MHFIIGLPMRATSNQEMSRVYVRKKKDKMVDRAARSLCMSHSRFNVAISRGGGGTPANFG